MYICPTVNYNPVMRGISIAKLITILLTGVLVVFLLPNFNFQFAGYLFKWQGVDLSLLGINSTLANFQTGGSLYPNRQVRFEIDSAGESTDPAELELQGRDITLIRNRMQLAGLTDVRLAQEISTGVRSLLFTFPNNYSETDAQMISSLLISPGTIAIWRDAGVDGEADPNINSYLLEQIAADYRPILAGVTSTDIENISVETRSNLQSASGSLIQTPVWRLRFREGVVSELNSLFEATQSSQPIYLAVDGEPTFILLAVPTVDSAGNLVAYTSGELLAVPLLTDDILQLKLQATYLTAGNGFSNSFTYIGTYAEQNIYATEGQSRLAIAIIVSFVLVVLWSIWKLGREKGVEFGILWGHFLVVGLAILKLGGAAISLGLILSIVFMSALVSMFIYQLVQLDGKQLIERRRIYRNFAVFMFFVSWLVFNLGVLSGLSLELVGLIGIWAGGLLISTMWGFRYLISR